MTSLRQWAMHFAFDSPFTRCHLMYHGPATPHLVSAPGPGHSKPHRYTITLQPPLDASHSLQAACRLMMSGPRGPQLLGPRFAIPPIGPRCWMPVPAMTTRILECRVTSFWKHAGLNILLQLPGPPYPSAGTGYGNTMMSELRWLSHRTATA